MEHVEESYKEKSDRELLVQVLDKLSKIETEIASLRWDVNALKLSSPPNSPDKNPGIIGSQGGYNSTQSGY